MPTSKIGRRGHARADRIAKRQRPPAFNPCPPGAIGGHYQPLSNDDMQAIFSVALKLLAELGMGEVPESLESILMNAGAQKQADRLVFPQDMDDEMHSHIYRTLRGIEVTEETLGYESICESVLGEGHFLGSAHTMAAMERDYFYPALADRDAPVTWKEKGQPDAWSRARSKAKAVLRTHHPEYLSTDAEERIRSEFNICLDA